jgi:hypothetical protein
MVAPVAFCEQVIEASVPALAVGNAFTKIVIDVFDAQVVGLVEVGANEYTVFPTKDVFIIEGLQEPEIPLFEALDNKPGATP